MKIGEREKELRFHFHLQTFAIDTDFSLKFNDLFNFKFYIHFCTRYNARCIKNSF